MDDPFTPEQRELFTLAATTVKAHPQRFRQAMLWLTTEMAKRYRKHPTTFSLLKAWGYLREMKPLGDLPVRKRLTQAHRILTVTWLLTDPDAHRGRRIPRKIKAWEYEPQYPQATPNKALKQLRWNRCCVRDWTLAMDKGWGDWTILVEQSLKIILTPGTTTQTPFPTKTKTAETMTKASQPTQTKKEIPWEDEAPEYVPNTLAARFSEGRMDVKKLGKLLTPDGEIRYMRRKRRCKVHIQDFLTYVQKLLELDDIAERAARAYLKKNHPS